MSDWKRDGLCDLMRQGFMRRKPEPKAKKPVVVVACVGCLNWHTKGKHTADAADRATNRAAAGVSIKKEQTPI